MAHQPIQFGERPGDDRVPLEGGESAKVTPVSLDLKRDEALTIEWSDGRRSVYPVGYLRKHSPSAEATTLREQVQQNPLTVLPAEMFSGGPTRAESAELVGNYALRIAFSDGHDTGLYSWAYLRAIDPGRADT